MRQKRERRYLEGASLSAWGSRADFLRPSGPSPASPGGRRVRLIGHRVVQIRPPETPEEAGQEPPERKWRHSPSPSPASRC